MDPFVVIANTYQHAMPFFNAASDRDRFLSYGDEFPEGIDLENATFWMAGGFATRLYVSGIRPRLSAPGPDWMSLVPEELLGRVVSHGTVDQMPDERVWAKPAEVKIPAMLPGWWSRDAVQSMGNPPETMYQWTATFLDGLDHEHRVFLVDGAPITWSAYLVSGQSYQWGTDSPHSDDAVNFAQTVSVSMGDDFPPTCSLDVGRLPDGRWIVVEANPAWSSGPYGCDMAKVIQVLDIACHESSDRWLWQPSAFAVERAQAHPATLVDPDVASGLFKVLRGA